MTNYTFQSLLDFTRTTSGTFVGSNGLIQTTPASVNLLTFTQDFDNAVWTKTNATITANATTAPDGTATADAVVEDATASAVHRLASSGSSVTSGLTYTLSVFAKKNAVDFLFLNYGSAFFGAAAAVFNIATGSVVSQTLGTASISSVGNGWYRCVFVVTAIATGSSQIFYQPSDNSSSAAYTGVNGRTSAFLWGAQLEVGSTATDYTRNNGGVYPARFDYDPATLQPKGILIEEQRVNLLLYSQDLTNAAWVPSNITVTANATTSPDGTVNAELLTPSSTSAIIYQTVNLTAASYTYSVWLRSGTGSNVSLNISANGSGVTPNPTSTAITVTPQWQRFTLQLSGLVATANIIIGSTTAGSWPSGATIYAWGAQVELGAFATSYIPTVASQVTRTADQCTITAPMFAPWYNQTQGTFVVNFDVLSVANTNQHNIFSLYTTATNYMRVWLWEGAPTLGRWTVSNVTTQADLTSSALSANSVIKNAVTYNLNDFASSYNGAAASTDTSGTVPVGFTQLNLGSFTGVTGIMCGHIRTIQFYPVRLADFQLQALTG